ncbi:MAG: hypothetical protein LBR80_09585 [Deltaproteobacteria bacterium]|nr:hypothetical protein [Deltaproteobacteria bacterium]
MPDADTEALPPAFFVDTEMSLSSPIELTWAFPPAPVAEIPPVASTEAIFAPPETVMPAPVMMPVPPLPDPVMPPVAWTVADPAKSEPVVAAVVTLIVPPE